MELPLCPKCGAYWECDCVFESLDIPVDPGCEHDWLDAVGVELLVDTDSPDAHVVVCRLCGAYSVRLTAES